MESLPRRGPCYRKLVQERNDTTEVGVPETCHKGNEPYVRCENNRVRLGWEQ